MCGNLLARSLASTVSLGVLLLSIPPALALEYRNTDLHYEFVLPQDWEVIPKDVVDEAFMQVASQSGKESEKFEAAFQKSSPQYFTYPYIFIKRSPLNGTLSQLAESISALRDKLKEDGAFRLLEPTEVRNLILGQPVVDSRRKMVLLNMLPYGTDVEAFKALVALTPGKDGMVTISFYAQKHEYTHYLPVFDSVLDGFAFDPGYEYSWPRAFTWTGRWSGKLLAGVVAGIITGLILAVYVWWSRRSQPPWERG